MPLEGRDLADALARMSPDQRDAYVRMQLSAPPFGMGNPYDPPEEGWLSKLMDLPGYLRYGVPTSEKERLAVSGELPGAPEDPSASQDVSNRYAAGYLFGREHPTVSRAVQPLVDMVKTSDLPFVGGSDPELQSWASQGVRSGSEAAGPRVPAGSAAEALLASARTPRR